MKPSENKSSAKCRCPYCDEELKLSCLEPAFCEPCKVEITVCEKCGAGVKVSSKSAHKCEDKK